MQPKHRSVCLVAVLAGLILVLSMGSSSFASSVQQKQKELKGVQSQMDQKKSNIFHFKRQEKSVIQQLVKNEQDLDTTRERLGDLKRQRAITEGAISRSAAELRQALAELAKTEAQLDAQVSVLKKRLRAMYVRGVGDYLELVLSSTDFTDFVTRFDLLERIVQQDIKLFQEVKAEKDRVDSEREKIEARKQSLEKRRAVLQGIERAVAGEQQRIAGKLQEREAYLKEIRSKRQLEERALDELEQTSQQISSMIAKLLAKSRTKVDPSDTGRMSWPVSGRVTSPYGWRVHPIFHNRRFHSGIDIAVASGTRVVAARSGVVIYSGWEGGYGKVVIIDHGGGISTTYAHNSVLSVSVGAKVSRGQAIARSGSTGYSTGPHVHFEVRVGKDPRDPMEWLR